MTASSDLSEKVTVIIRSVDERTEVACRNLVLEQGIKPDGLITIREKPFSKALRLGCEIGIQEGRPWTFFVDADVLLRRRSIDRIINLAESQSDNVCEIQCYVLDKFFGGPRPAGNHLYRTSLLPEFLNCIPEEGVNIRPETYALTTMATRGFPWVSVSEVVGLHDFEQSYQDIFRKSFVHSHKHLFFAEYLVSFWRDRARDDKDYLVALAGFGAGIRQFEETRIDSRHSHFSDWDKWIDVPAKHPLEVSIWNLDRIDREIEEWVGPEAFMDVFPTAMVEKSQSFWMNCRRFLRMHEPKRGKFKTLLLALSLLLGHLPKKLRQYLEFR